MLGGKGYATLIIGVGFFMSGGVSQVVGETLPVEPELLEITKPEFIKEIEPEFIEVLEPEFIEVTEFEVIEPFVSSDGLTKRGGEPKSLKEIMCAKRPRLLTPEECLFVGQ